MGKLRAWLFIFIASTFIFAGLYLEILAPLPVIETHLGVYILLTVAVLGEFLFPQRLFTPLYYFTLAGVMAVSAGLYLNAATISPEDFNISIFGLFIELGFSAWLVYTAHTLSASLRTLEAREEVLRIMGIEDPSLDIREAKHIIHAEITRSRHYDRSLSLFALGSVDMLAPEGLEEAEGAFSNWVAGEYTRARFARVIKTEMRAMDLVIRDPETHNLILLCPEVSAGDAHEVACHLETVVNLEFGIQPLVASVSFPEDGISFEGLYKKVMENLAHKVEGAMTAEAKTILV